MNAALVHRLTSVVFMHHDDKWNTISKHYAAIKGIVPVHILLLCVLIAPANHTVNRLVKPPPVTAGSYIPPATHTGVILDTYQVPGPTLQGCPNHLRLYIDIVYPCSVLFIVMNVALQSSTLPALWS